MSKRCCHCGAKKPDNTCAYCSAKCKRDRHAFLSANRRKLMDYFKQNAAELLAKPILWFKLNNKLSTQFDLPRREVGKAMVDLYRLGHFRVYGSSVQIRICYLHDRTAAVHLYSQERNKMPDTIQGLIQKRIRNGEPKQEKAIELWGQNVSMPDIAKRLHTDIATVRRYVEGV